MRFVLLLAALVAITMPVSAQTAAPAASGVSVVTQPDTGPDPTAVGSKSAPQEAAAVGPGSNASSTYKLQPYDLIDVDVYGEEDLHKPARLGADGTALLPLVGPVKLSGLTVTQANALVTKKYSAGFVKDPNVLITVLQYRKSTFSILGQVQRPGTYEIPEGSHVTIIDAISLSGGFTQTAAQNAVSVKRSVDGKAQTFNIKAADMAQNADSDPFELLAGDTVVVSLPAYRKTNFSVLGQVGRAGLYEIPAGAHVTIIDAISLAGGFAGNAAQNEISVKRIIDGKQQILTVRAADMAQNPSIVPFEVLPGDIVLIPARKSSFSILGQVNRPGIYEVPEGGHVNIVEAVLMAGGFTHTAAQNSVTVKRSVEGKVQTLKVRAGDMASKANIAPFEVLPGDIIKVNESWF